jgi:broad specificity phosphatase PhoE
MRRTKSICFHLSESLMQKDRQAQKKLSLALRALVDQEHEEKLLRIKQRHELPLHSPSHQIQVKDLQPLALPKIKTLISVRHGQTYANAYDILAGVSDTKLNQLTADGIAQAEQAAEELSQLRDTIGLQIDIILVSPLGRARRTAQIIANRLGLGQDKLKVCRIFSEHHCGVLENVALKPLSQQKKAELRGLTEQPLKTLPSTGDEREKLNRLYDCDMLVAPSQGESMDAVIRRQRLALQWIEMTYPHQNVMVVSHAIVGGAFTVLLKNFPESACVDGKLQFFKQLPRHGQPNVLIQQYNIHRKNPAF